MVLLAVASQICNQHNQVLCIRMCDPMSFCLPVCPSVCQFACPVCLCVLCLSVCLFVCLTVCECVCVLCVCVHVCMWRGYRVNMNTVTHTQMGLQSSWVKPSRNESVPSNKSGYERHLTCQQYRHDRPRGPFQ